MKIQDFINRNKQEATPEEVLNRYSGMSEEQMMQELFRVGSVSTGGTTPQQLDSFYTQVQSFLSAEQKARMDELIRQLKNS